MQRSEILAIPIPTAEPLRVTVREDRSGRGKYGFERFTGECGCLMTQVCYTLGIHPDAQDELYSSEAGEKLVTALREHGAPTDGTLLGRLVRDVQKYQDISWELGVQWDNGDSERDEEKRKETMDTALQALRRLGCVVEWVPGTLPTERPFEDYTWLRQVSAIA